MINQTRTNPHHTGARAGHRVPSTIGTTARVDVAAEQPAHRKEHRQARPARPTNADAPGQNDNPGQQHWQYDDRTAATATMLTVPEAARLLGIGRTLAYDLIRTGTWPTPILRMGRLVKVPSGPLHELLATGHIPI